MTRKRLKVRDYSWARQMEAVCITAIHRGSEAAVLTALSADVGSQHLADFATALGEQEEDRTVVQLWRQGEHLIVAEPNGFAGSLPNTLLPMVGDRDAVSVYWNVNANMRVVVVDLGDIVRTFDPLMYDDGDRPLAEEAGLGFGDPDNDVIGGALNVLERRTGVVLTEKVVGEQHPTYFAMAAGQRGRK